MAKALSVGLRRFVVSPLNNIFRAASGGTVWWERSGGTRTTPNAVSPFEWQWALA